MPPTSTTTPPTTLRRSTCTKKVPSYLHDFQTHNITRYPIYKYISYNNLSSSFHHVVFSINFVPEPRTYSRAFKDLNGVKPWQIN